MFVKVTHKSSQCILPNPSDTVENCHKYRFDNHRDAYIESLNLNRHKRGNTGEEPCKYNDCVSSFNLCSIISQHQKSTQGGKDTKIWTMILNINSSKNKPIVEGNHTNGGNVENASRWSQT